MVGAEDIVEMRDCVDGGEKGAIEPAASLQDQLRYRVGHIGFAIGRLDVLQDPVTIPLGNQLKAEDSILGQVHV